MEKHPAKELAIRVLLFILAAISLAGTFFPLLPWEAWYIRMFDFPRLQTFFITLAALLLFYFLFYRKRKRGKFLLLLLLLVMVYQSTRIYPYTSFGPEEVLFANQPLREKDAISILVSNIYMHNQQCDRFLQLVEEQNPDIVLVLETDAFWQQQLSSLREQYPNYKEIPLPNTYGMLFYSRLPLKDLSVQHLVEEDIPSISSLVQLPSGNWIQLYGVHPRPPVPGESTDSKERDAEIIIIGKKAKHSPYPVIVAGDFNDVAWSPTTHLFREVSGLLDPRIGRGFYNTFHAEYPVFRWPLDHVFHSSHFKLVALKRLEHIGSDHFPILIHLQLTPQGPAEQQEPEPDKDTDKEADKTIQEGLEDEAKGK